MTSWSIRCSVCVPVLASSSNLAFEPGGTVAAGDLLVQQDTSTEEAQLRAAEAAADLARTNRERTAALLAVCSG